MCVAIYKPKHAAIDQEVLEQAYLENGDGCGLAYRRNGGLAVKKGVVSFDRFLQHYTPLQNQELLIHFRWASQGHVNKDNCHPFTLANGGALIHNGHLQGYGSKAISDTRDWIKRVLEPLLVDYPKALDSIIVRDVLEKAIGASKMVIMRPHGRAVLLNEHAGTWAEDGAWYSQRHFLAPAPQWPAWAIGKDTGKGSVWDTCKCDSVWHEPTCAQYYD